MVASRMVGFGVLTPAVCPAPRSSTYSLGVGAGIDRYMRFPMRKGIATGSAWPVTIRVGVASDG